MSDAKMYAVSPEWKKRAWLDEAKYKEMYAASVKDPEKFWGEEARKRIHWMKPFTKVKSTSFDGDVSIKWFEDGKTNISYNCIDRHLEKRGDQVAIIWEGDEPTDDKKITYKELHAEVCRWANVLKKQGAKKGDRITIYMPMIPEAAYTCSPAHASAQSIQSCSAAFRRIASRAASRTAHRTSSLPLMKAFVAGARFRSKPTPTPPATRPAASRP